MGRGKSYSDMAKIKLALEDFVSGPTFMHYYTKDRCYKARIEDFLKLEKVENLMRRAAGLSKRWSFQPTALQEAILSLAKDRVRNAVLA